MHSRCSDESCPSCRHRGFQRRLEAGVGSTVSQAVLVTYEVTNFCGRRMRLEVGEAVTVTVTVTGPGIEGAVVATDGGVATDDRVATDETPTAGGA